MSEVLLRGASTGVYGRRPNTLQRGADVLTNYVSYKTREQENARLAHTIGVTSRAESASCET